MRAQCIVPATCCDGNSQCEQNTTVESSYPLPLRPQTLRSSLAAVSTPTVANEISKHSVVNICWARNKRVTHFCAAPSCGAGHVLFHAIPSSPALYFKLKMLRFEEVNCVRFYPDGIAIFAAIKDPEELVSFKISSRRYATCATNLANECNVFSNLSIFGPNLITNLGISSRFTKFVYSPLGNCHRELWASDSARRSGNARSIVFLERRTYLVKNHLRCARHWFFHEKWSTVAFSSVAHSLAESGIISTAFF